MALHLTPELLERSYDLLRATPPFKRWRLPPGDEVEFHVTRSPARAGDCEGYGDIPVVRLSAALHATLPAVLMTMAHEMCHLYLARAHPDDRAHHGWRFRRAAKLVCRHHTFDEKAF